MNYYNDCIMVREQRKDQVRDIEVRCLLQQAPPRPSQIARVCRQVLALTGAGLGAAGSYLRNRFGKPVPGVHAGPDTRQRAIAR